MTVHGIIRLQVNSRLSVVKFLGSYTRVFDCVWLGISTPNSCIVPGTTIILLLAIGVRMGERRYLVTIEGFVGVIFAGVGELGGPLELEQDTGFL